jgi:hypothetical protein
MTALIQTRDIEFIGTPTGTRWILTPDKVLVCEDNPAIQMLFGSIKYPELYFDVVHQYQTSIQHFKYLSNYA